MNSQLFRVLSDQNRLAMVELLYKNPQSVNEIADKLHIRQPQVSKHLKVLADAGVVDVHPEKNKRVYVLQPESFKELEKWLEKYRKMWEARFDRLDTLLQQEMQTRPHSGKQNFGEVKKEVKKHGRK